MCVHASAWVGAAALNSPPRRCRALQDHAATNPLYIGAYPFIGVGSIAAVLPFFLALSFSSEFARLHPLRPSDYCYLGSRLLRALQSNTLKVTAKEL